MIKVRTAQTRNILQDCGYTREEEGEIYEAQIADLYAHPRWYLDNVETMQTYRVSWKCYKHTTPTQLLTHVKKKPLKEDNTQ